MSLVNSPSSTVYSFFFIEVLMPKGKYNGQKLMNDVSTNTTAKTPNTIANVPEITFVKYNVAITTATSMRIALSAVPIFFFIVFALLIYYLIYILHSSAIDDIVKTIAFQNTLCLTASAATSAKNNDVLLVFEFG
jgi:hypothetical protein